MTDGIPPATEQLATQATSGVVIAGFTVPGLTTREVQMGVELNLGETIVVALQSTIPDKLKATADAAPSGEPGVTLFTLTPSPVKNR